MDDVVSGAAEWRSSELWRSIFLATAIFEWFEIIFLKNIEIIRGKIETIKISINSIITSALKVLILQTLYSFYFFLFCQDNRETNYFCSKYFYSRTKKNCLHIAHKITKISSYHFYKIHFLTNILTNPSILSNIYQMKI